MLTTSSISVGLECLGRRGPLLRGRGLANAEPRGGEPDGGHGGAERRRLAAIRFATLPQAGW
jgi:hypothetical protein